MRLTRITVIWTITISIVPRLIYAEPTDAAIRAAVDQALRFEASQDVVVKVLSELAQKTPGKAEGDMVRERLGQHNLSTFLLMSKAKEVDVTACAYETPGPDAAIARVARERLSTRKTFTDIESITDFKWETTEHKTVEGTFRFDGVVAKGTCKFRAVPAAGRWVVRKLVIANRTSDNLDDGHAVFVRSDDEVMVAAKQQGELAESRASAPKPVTAIGQLTGLWCAVQPPEAEKQRIELVISPDGTKARMAQGIGEKRQEREFPCALQNGMLKMGEAGLAPCFLDDGRLIVGHGHEQLVFERQSAE